MKSIEKEISLDRRAFIKKVLGGTIAGSLLLVIPAGAMELEHIPEQIPGMRKEIGPFITGKKFAFIVDITRCIGCGSCCVADKNEYQVPDGNYRTWVERYVIDDKDNVYVDSPNGGLDGYQKPRKDLPY
ncbi:MAG TPA: 4Fe-4S dicluster domain-containing protein, partial [Desulfobulbaceae bacterium]|nr:4Fe-4S dicluster domain-containing protein [Desulfobulbaceae bacterium]